MLFKTGGNNKFSVLVLGFSALLTQIIVLREFLTVFHGNELVMGLVLANWMLLTGAGAWAGRYFPGKAKPAKFIVILQLLIAVIPVFTVFEISLIRVFFFPYGKIIGFVQSWLVIFLTLVPFCLVSGLMFPLLSREISERSSINVIQKVYSFDALGGIIGGLLFNLVFVFFFDAYQSLTVVLFLNCSAAFITLWLHHHKTHAFFLAGIFVGLLVLIIYADPEKLMNRLIYKGQQVLELENTPYGKLAVTSTGEQYNFFENGVPLFSTGDPVQREEAVHFAMLLHDDPREILLISGGISGTLDEILKYPIDRIDYLEINPWLIRLGREYVERLTSPKVRIINKDARLFLRQSLKRYDVILVNVPDPSSAEINRYYTLDFFRELKGHLNDNGVISISLSTTGNYMSEESRSLHSAIYITLLKVFRNIRIIPGNRDYFIASDRNLEVDFTKTLIDRGITNDYVNQYYINQDLLKQRSDLILKNLDPSVKVNTDFRPVTYYQYLQYWLSQFKFRLWTIPVFLLILIIIFFIFLSPVNLGLFTGGFSAASLEFILLILFQVIYGYVYLMTGILVTVFMAGLAAGSWYAGKLISGPHFRHFKGIQLIIALYSFLLPAFMILLRNISTQTLLTLFIFFILTVLLGIIIGIQFAFAIRIVSEKIIRTASKTYSADLLGSAIGVLLISSFVMPVIGLIPTTLLIGGLNLLALILMHLRGKKIYLYK
jgi:spermidine synthase